MDRSLPRHLLTIALTLFIICGFTVTPIAAAELMGGNYDTSYDGSVTGVLDSIAATEDTEDTDSDDPVDGVAVAFVLPAVVEISIGDVLVVFVTSVFLTIAGWLGFHWDDLDEESWNNFVLDVQHAINQLFHKTEWVDATSDEGNSALTTAYQIYTAGGGSGGKKDDKFFFKGRYIKETKKVQIYPERINEEEAVKALREHNDIMTVDKDLAKDLYARERGGLTEEEIRKLEFEVHHEGEEGYFAHLHLYIDDIRLHIWSWK